MSTVDNLLINPASRRQTKRFLQNPGQSLLILGPVGSGKLNAGLKIACDLLRKGSTEQLHNYPYFMHIKKASNKQDISINEIRAATRFLRLKTPGSLDTIRRLVLIEDAQYLSIEAQNALLKLLEEPSNDTVFVLTAPTELSLLPTIVSRCQRIQINSVSLQQATSYYSDRFESRKIESAWRLSQGSSALIDALLKNDKDHPLKRAIEDAKTFLSQPKYERLLMVEKIAKDKTELHFFLEALSKVLAALHKSAISKRQTKQANKLLRDRKLVHAIISQINTNANTRLISLDLLLSLKS